MKNKQKKPCYDSLCGPDLGGKDKTGKDPVAAFCSCFYPAGYPECLSLHPA